MNPVIKAQAIDLAHRIGQIKQGIYLTYKIMSGYSKEEDFKTPAIQAETGQGYNHHRRKFCEDPKEDIASLFD